jgi:hypothetical protein
MGGKNSAYEGDEINQKCQGNRPSVRPRHMAILKYFSEKQNLDMQTERWVGLRAKSRHRMESLEWSNPSIYGTYFCGPSIKNVI